MGCGVSTAAPPPTIVQHVPEAAAAATPTTPSRGTDAAQAVPTLTPREEIEAFLHEHALDKAPTWRRSSMPSSRRQTASRICDFSPPKRWMSSQGR